MASVISKRQQARNERALQDLLRSVPGNDVCADCQARNPGWASWNLGIFLCMRCASLHRKLGTHISKVKSLSMDTWSSEQVESMKSHGNVIVNKTFNPKNAKPDIPLDADEVDSAMERFIRKKYQERSLLNGKPRLPSRGADSELTNSIDESPPPPLPPKKGKLFGFGLRASSSAYPSSKNDRKKLPIEPTFEGAFGIASADFEGSTDDNHSQRAIAFHAALEDEDMREKLRVLREMGFRDEEQNTYVLKRLNSRLELAVEYLIKHGKTKPQGGTIAPAEPTRKASTTFPEVANNAATQAPQIESNLSERRTVSDQFGLSFNTSHQQQSQAQMPNSGTVRTNGATLSTNPFDSQPAPATTVASLEQSFQGMQIARPLFPNSTGGYPVPSQPQFDPRLQHSITPPVPLIPQQYGFVASPPAINVTSNPFFQDSQSSQSPFSNPYASAMQTPSAFASSNPFFSQMASSANHQQAPQQPQLTMNSQNPFGIPPSEPQAQQPHFQQQTNAPSPQPIFDQNQQAFYTNSNTPQNLNQPMASQQLPSQLQASGQLGYANPFGNFQNTQAAFQQPTQPQFQPQQAQAPQQSQFQPQAQQPSQPQFQPQQAQPPQQSQFQPQAQQPSQPQFNYQSQMQQPLYPQQTGRIDKNSILALYNYPHLAPQRPSLPSIGETTDAQPATMSSAPSNDLYSGSGTTSAKRSVTMPAPSTTSSALMGSRNPFLKNAGSGSGSPNTGVHGGVRHVSNESVAIANSEHGRHSPDAFANLSARYA